MGRNEVKVKRKKEKVGKGGRERIYTSTHSRIYTFKKITRAARADCVFLTRTFLKGLGVGKSTPHY